MMPCLAYLRPSSIDDARALLRLEPNARLLAGGQSLLAAAKLGLASPSHLLDLRHLKALNDIREVDGNLWIGAMVTHHQIAINPTVAKVLPMLCALARDIADQQVRNRGTIGGSIALHDPSACWPAGVLASGATIVTSEREISADDFFTGLYATALAHDEIILGLRFKLGQRGFYLKTLQKASHFALVGVAVTVLADRSVRVALTGLGYGVTRWLAAEAALMQQFAPESLFPIGLTSELATSDLHASAAYRCHLARVLAIRATAKLCAIQEPRTTRIPRLPARIQDQSPLAAGTPGEAASVTPKESLTAGTIQGEHWLSLPIDEVWTGIQNPQILERSIPGCESMRALDAQTLQATIKVGLGFISAQFETQIQMHDLEPPAGAEIRAASLRMTLSGKARGLGSGHGKARVTLKGNVQGTLLTWSVLPEVQGQLAQLGSRMMQATATKLSQAFFLKLSQTMGAHESPTLQPLSPSGGGEGILVCAVAKIRAHLKRLGQRFTKRIKVNDK